jgi:phosphatidylglycerophosphatase A
MATEPDSGTPEPAPRPPLATAPESGTAEPAPPPPAVTKADSGTSEGALARLRARPAGWIALGLGAGLMRPGPGTWGTALAWLIFAVVAPQGAQDPATALAVLAVALLVGIWASDRAAALLGLADPAVIVVDEMVAFWLVLVCLPGDAHRFAWQLAAFLLFRAFDIGKPPPIDWVDRRWKNAWGVMADDLVAAGYTLLVLALARRLMGAG